MMATMNTMFELELQREKNRHKETPLWSFAGAGFLL